MFHLKILLFEWRKTVDIVFITKGNDREVVREFADSAIDQIFKLRYFADLHGDIQLYGMTARQKDAFVSYRKIRR